MSKGFISELPNDPVAQMKKEDGKKPHSINSGWSIVRLTKTEFENLIFYECEGLRNDKIVIPEQGFNYRLLKNVAENAKSFFNNKPASLSNEQQRAINYYKSFSEGKIKLEGDNRIFLLRANTEEIKKNPAGEYYIKDGSGRALAYMTLLLQDKIQWAPVEAFFCNSI
jgi:hypothetical protein